MARRTTKTTRTTTTTTRESKGRETTARSRREAEPAAALEVVEEKQGLGIGDGVTVVTSLLLLVAILMVDYLLGHDYGSGLFFK